MNKEEFEIVKSLLDYIRYKGLNEDYKRWVEVHNENKSRTI